MTPMLRLRAAAVVAVIALGLVGCGTGATTPSAAGSGAASPPPTSSSGPKSLPPSGEPTALPSSSGTLAVPHADPELEAKLPDEFDGQPLSKLSVDPISSAAGGSEALRDLAREIGDGTGNFSLAYAASDTDQSFNLFALRVPGAGGEPLVDGFAAITLADTRGAESEQVTIGSKAVTHIIQPGNPIGDVWFYAVGDTLFGVQAGSPEQAETLLALLP